MQNDDENKYFIVNNTIIRCLDDYDCPYTSVCYDRNENEEGKCGCDVEWGDIGNQCNEKSSMSYYRIISMLWKCIRCNRVDKGTAYAEFDGNVDEGNDGNALNNENNNNNKSNNKGVETKNNNNNNNKGKKPRKDYDVRITAFIECLLCLIFLILYFISSLLMVLNPMEEPLNVKYSTNKKRSLAYVRSVGLVLFMFFFIAALLNVSILWLEVIAAAVNWYDSTLTGIVAAVLFSIVLVLYAYSAYSITLVMKMSYYSTKKQMNMNKDKRSEAMKQSLLKIRRCAIQVVSLLGIWIIFMIYLSIKHPMIREKTTPKGQILDIIVLIDIGFASAILAIWSLIFYLRKPADDKSSSSNGQVRQVDEANSPKTPNGDGYTSSANNNNKVSDLGPTTMSLVASGNKNITAIGITSEPNIDSSS